MASLNSIFCLIFQLKIITSFCSLIKENSFLAILTFEIGRKMSSSSEFSVEGKLEASWWRGGQIGLSFFSCEYSPGGGNMKTKMVKYLELHLTWRFLTKDSWTSKENVHHSYVLLIGIVVSLTLYSWWKEAGGIKTWVRETNSSFSGVLGYFSLKGPGSLPV